MRGFGKILFGFSILTGALLLYVHEQVEILRVSYRIHEKASLVSQKAEEFRRLKFDVAQLRSPQNLETRLGELLLPLTLPKEIQVLRVPGSVAPLPQNLLPLHLPSNKFFDFLGQWVQIAQARTDD